MTRKDSVLTVNKSRSLLAALTKVANDLVDVAAAPGAEQSDAGSAGPQEVVDALESVIDEIAQISEAIPAEASGQEDLGVEAPVEEAPVEAPVAEESVEEEEPRLAKKVRALEAQLDSQNREILATKFAELFDEPKVQQAKYDEVLNSKDSLATWTAKIDSIEQYKTTHEGASSSYRPAKTMTSWIKPQSKFAKQASNEMMSL